MIAETDILWNGRLYEAGKPIPANEKKLISSLDASSEAEPAVVKEGLIIKPKDK